MSFTLIMAVTAAIAGSMGYLAARRKEDEAGARKDRDRDRDQDREGDEPGEKGAGKLDSKKQKEQDGKQKDEGKPAPKSKPGKAAATAKEKSPFEGLPLKLGDVVSSTTEERWLAGALVAREEGRVLSVLFIAPEGAKLAAVAAFAPPRKEIFWMDPAELVSPEEPPATIELNGVALRRKGRLPVAIERLGQGAPSVGEEAIWGAYEGGAGEVAIVITGQGKVFAWMGQRLAEEQYDRLGEGE
jgi:hypothetical protein